MRTPKTPRLTQPNIRRTLIAAAFTASLLSSARADYEAEVMSENPIAYYRFNDDVGVEDQATPEVNFGSLGATANGTLSDTVVRLATGALTGSADPSSTAEGNAFTVPYTAGLNHQGSFSVEVWLKPTLAETPGFTSPIASWRENTDTFGREGWLIYQGATTDGFIFRTYNKNGGTFAASISSGTGVAAGAWHHVVATWDDGAKLARIYVNGVLKATSGVIPNGGTNNRAFDANTSGGFTLGSRSDNGFGWAGGIDEPAYYAGTVRSPAQIQAHYNNGINPTPSPAYNTAVLADGPAGYWRMNNTAVPQVADNIGSLANAADGAYHGDSKNTLTGPSPSSGFLGFGAGNSALSLASGTGNVATALSLLNDRSAFTVMGWVKRGAVHSTRGGYFGQNDLLEFGDAGTGTQIEAYVNARAGNVVTAYSFPDDQWGFIVLTGDSSKATLYLDGVQVGTPATGNGSIGTYGTNAFKFKVGGGGIFNTAGDYFRGEIDEVAVFDKAVTPGRVKQLYDAALGNVAPGLVDLYPTVTPLGEIPEGQPYSLTVDPTGTPPFTYQWKLNGTDIPGATSKVYNVPSAAAHTPNPLDPFTYTVVVTNSTNSITSNASDVYVTPVLRWTSAAATNAGKWDVSTLSPSPLNWKTFTTGTASAYLDFDYSVLFDDTATAPTASSVALTQDVSPRGIVFDNTARNYTLTGPAVISSAQPGSGAVKKGTGTVVLANDIFNMDTLTVNAGTLQVGDGTNGTLSAITAVTVAGGQLVINQASGSIYESPTVLNGGPISFVGSGDLRIAPQGAATLSGLGNEVFNRNGTTVVAGANLVGGTVTINTGTVAFDGSQNANRLPNGKTVTVNPGATMEVRGVNALPTGGNSPSPTLIQATLNVVSGNSAAQTGGSHAHLNNITLDGSQVFLSYSGAGGVYSGESFQLNGNLTVAGSTASTISYGSGANPGNAGIAPSAGVTHTITVPNVAIGPDLTISAEIENTDSGTPETAILAKVGVGTLRLADGISHPFTGTTQINGGTLEATGSIGGPLVIGASGTISPGTGSTATFTAGATTLAGAYACQIDGAVSDSLVANGNLVLQAGASVNISVLSPATAPYYEIARCTGTLSGTLPTLTGTPPPGYALRVVSGASLILAPTTVVGGVTASTPPPSGTEDFNTSGGAFSVSAPVSPQTDWTYSNGHWLSFGQDAGTAIVTHTSYLSTPIYSVTQAGPVTLSLSHKYTFEVDYDAGAVEISLNGGAFTRLPGTAFTQNGYDGTLAVATNSALAGQEGFLGDSDGYPAYFTTTATLLANAAVGDTIQVRFMSASDDAYSPGGWEIDSFTITGALPNLLKLEWPFGVMQYSNNLHPPWTDLSGSTSPLLIDMKAAPRRFFRVKP